MSHFRYIIVGGGMTADAAVRGIRLPDPSGSIAILTDEQHQPYSRPPLSKALWKGDPLETIWRNTPQEHTSILTRSRVTKLSVQDKSITTENGEKHTYDRLLLATGGRVRKLAGAPEDIVYYRTLDDYNKLRQVAQKGSHVVVIGGGFIGSEIAAALAMNEVSVTMIFPEEGIGSRIYPESFWRYLNSYFGSHGVRVLAGRTLKEVKKDGNRFIVVPMSMEPLRADGVVAGIGIEPNDELARQAGIRVDNGIVVDQALRTSASDVFAAGDVARFFNPSLGVPIRVEHEDNSLTMGDAAGRSMAGESVEYDHLPFFYSDLFDLGYEAVGELSARLTTMEDWKEPNHKGVVYYMREGRVRGVLLVNTWGQVDAARTLIADKGPWSPEMLRGKITDD
jgi:3-phenylpropionate/trans-cinnamate dioxygenase ferredoxin reductase subunit